MKLKFESRIYEYVQPTTFAALKALVASDTLIPSENQKLIYKGKRVTSDESFALVPPDAVLMLVGLRSDDLEKIQSTNEKRSKVFTLPVGKANISRKEVSPYSFARLESLQEFCNPDDAISYLARLAEDKGVVAIMKKREYSVGLLKELHPLRDASILGYNKNKGEEIALRLRTDDLRGFRHYKEVKRVLLHELTHMVHSDHDDKFYALNRELDKEAIALDWTLTKGYKISNQEFYEPLDERRYQSLLDSPEIVDAHGYASEGHVLGGGSGGKNVQDRRQVAEKAALERLKRQ